MARSKIAKPVWQCTSVDPNDRLKFKIVCCFKAHDIEQSRNVLFAIDASKVGLDIAM